MKLMRIKTLLYVGLLLLFFTSTYMWIGWGGRNVFIDAFADVLLLFVLVAKRKTLSFSNRNVLSLLFLIIGELYIIGEFPLWVVTSVLIPISVIVLLNDKDRIAALDFIFRFFAIFMLLSIITYILVKTIGIPSFGTVQLIDDDMMIESYRARQNYFFCVDDMNIGRFCGPFVEPGHLGTLCALVLFATGFDFKKKETIIYLVALLMTLSLAGYVMCCFAYLFTRLIDRKISAQKVALVGLGLLLVLLISKYFNNGANVLNEMIISRLDMSNEDNLSYMTHTTGDFNYYFALLFNNVNLLLFGYGEVMVEWIQQTTQSSGSGFVFFVVKHGLIGFFMSILFYLVYTMRTRNKRLARIFFIFMILAIYQRSYAFSAAWIMCFVYGITTFEQRLRLSKK